MPKLHYTAAGLCGMAFILAGGAFNAWGQDDAISFQRDVRPILNDHCFQCHGPDKNKRQADLRLDDRASVTRVNAVGDAVIFPGDPTASELISRISEADDDLRMPPPGAGRRLTEAEVATLVQWVQSGAAYEPHWAFVAPIQPKLPEVQNETWPRNPIDYFVLAHLERSGMSPAPPADRATLIRRLALDLTGLPPSIEEVDAFLADSSPDAYEQLVDRFLASPHYGERMALPWLDAARYADSNGFQQDGDTWQWIWRDWVVGALNDDLPFDQFTLWQLAGDLLPDATTQQKIASAFNRNHLLNGEGGAIAEEQRFVNLFDRVDTTATNWLGLTMACAQCHDHKYDPITQHDYYSLLDAFNRVPENGTPQFFSSRIRVDAPYIELPTEENLATISELESAIAAAQPAADAAVQAAFEGWRLGLLSLASPADSAELPDAIKTILSKPEGERSDQDREELESALRSFFDGNVRAKLVDKLPPLGDLEQLKRKLDEYKKDQIPRLMIMSDDRPRETHVLDRGAYLSPLDQVSFNTPAFLPPLPDDAPRNRLGLAQWLVAPENPLTARVQVNRMWQHFFGTGLVKTSEDFGVQSEFPVHQDLLDWLAVEFRNRGWSMKQMHRLILTSATYRQSSRMQESHRQHDPENRWMSRATRIRIPAMILRDWALAAAGLLESKIGGKPVYPYQPDGIWGSLAITKERDFTYPASTGSDLYRRSLYTFWRRTVAPANMFDNADRRACRVRASVTNTPLHALTMLNDPTWTEAARMLAEVAWRSADNLDGRIEQAFRRVLCRRPTATELSALRRTYERQLEFFQEDLDAARNWLSIGAAARDESLDTGQLAAMSALCLAILNLDEAITRE